MSVERETTSVPEMLAALKHLGGGEHEVSKPLFSVDWKKLGYSCITCEINSSTRHIKHGPARYDIVVWWWKGRKNALKDALDEAISRSRWCTLKDDKNVVYFQRQESQPPIEKDLEELQRRVEDNPNVSAKLFLEL